MMPTIEQVREHAERYPLHFGGGLWRYNLPDTHLCTQRVCVVPLDDTTRANYERYEWPAKAAWTPCDQAGNPLPLVERAETAEENVEVCQARERRLVTYIDLLKTKLTEGRQERDAALARVRELEAQLESARAEAREWQEEAVFLSHDMAEARAEAAYALYKDGSLKP